MWFDEVHVALQGVDVTFGPASCYGGVLIRSICPLDDPSALVEGSCKVVDRILKLTKKGSIVALVDGFPDEVPSIEDSGSSCLFVAPLPKEAMDTAAPLLLSSRVGLSLKRGAPDTHGPCVASWCSSGVSTLPLTACFVGT